MASGLEAIVERQMRNWELSRQQPLARAEGKPSETVHHFIAVARSVGEKLGWPVYNREILDYMAEADVVQRRIYALRDERHEGWLESIMSALSPEKPYKRDDYFHKLARAVLTIAQNEHAVFVGRGAAFLLPADRGLHVRIVCPLELCVANLAAREGLSPEEAEKRIRRAGRERATFFRAHFVPEPWAADHYDLVLNVGGLSPDAVQDIILLALARKTGHQT